MDLQPGDVFAGLRIEGVAGRGGMGVVFRAVQPSLDRVVALKTIAPALAADPAFSARFVRESKAAAAVEHPNVLPVFSAGEEHGVLYIVMRYVDGPDLRTLVRAAGRLDADRAAPIVAQVAAALGSAHARGLVHRDVKPANILLDATDHAYLTDFGLTKRLHSDASAATRPGGWVGTLGYVAPEQIRDQQVDGRTDVYALGCVLFHALAGAPPFERSTDEATLWAHLNEPPPALPVGAPATLGAVVERALAKDPADRFPTAGELGRAVLAAVGRPARDVAGLDAPPAAAAPAAERTRSAPPEERADATGATARAVTPEPTAPTAASPPATARDRRRRSILVLGAGAVAVVAALAAVLAPGGTGGGDAGREGRPGAGTTTAGAGWLRVDGVRLGGRPNGVAVARGRAYVTLPRSPRLARVDLGGFDRRRPGPRVGRGALDIDAGFGALWVTSASDRERLTRIDLDDGRRTVTVLPDGTPVAVDAGESAVWVGLRGARMRTYPPHRVVRLDPRSGRVVRTVEIPRGVQDLTVGDDAVWIANRASDTLTRLDIASGRLDVVPTGRGPSGVAIGGGAVWVANEESSTVTRIDRDDLRDTAAIGVEGNPRGVAYGGGSAWVAGFTTSSLVRIPARTGRPSPGRAELALNPTKLTVSGGAVYVVSPAGGELQRVRFASPPFP